MSQLTNKLWNIIFWSPWALLAIQIVALILKLIGTTSCSWWLIFTPLILAVGVLACVGYTFRNEN